MTEIEREFRLETTTESVELALLGTRSIGDRFHFGLGPVIGFNYRRESEQSDHILGPGDLSFPDGQGSRTMVEGPTYTTRPLSFGLTAAAGAHLPVASRFSLLLEAGSRLDLLSPVREAAWSSLELSGNLGILYDLNRREHQPDPPQFTFPPDPSPPPPVDTILASSPAKPRLSASIQVYGLEGEERRKEIRVNFREVDRCKVVRLAPGITFPEGETDLPEEYRTRGPGDRIPFDSLVALDPFALQGRLLDLIGIRMGNNRGARLALQPEGNDSLRGEQRAERIRDYLTRIWDVDSLRVEVLPVAGSEGRKERVGISSPSADILAPVVSRRLDRDFDAPMVKVQTSQEVEAGLRAWEIVLSNDEEEIARYSSAQPDAGGSAGIDWSVLYSDRDLDSSTIRGVFMIQDSTGERRIARDETLLIVRKSRITEERIIDLQEGNERFLYGIPSSDGHPLDSLAWNEVLRPVKEGVREGASVMIPSEDDAPPEEGEDIREDVLRRLRPYEPQFIPHSRVEEHLKEFGRCRSSGEENGRRILLLSEQLLELP